MIPNNADIDPFSPETNYFECIACGKREISDKRLTICKGCGGQLQNIAVPRE
jgi:rRNA maturation endonuclease Nob1